MNKRQKLICTGGKLEVVNFATNTQVEIIWKRMDNQEFALLGMKSHVHLLITENSTNEMSTHS